MPRPPRGGCSIDGCKRRHQARGWAMAHYAQWRKHGDPLYMAPPKPITHGTYSTYTSRKCRCESCRAAASAYYRSKLPVDPDEAAQRNLANLLRYVYGIDVARYEALLEAQGGVCAICGNPPGKSRRDRLCVDHCHDSGVIRGLLCLRCNSAIGMLRDNPDFIRSALAYVEKHVGLKVVA